MPPVDPGLQADPLAGLVPGHPGTQPGSFRFQYLPSQYPYVRAPQPLFQAQLNAPLHGLKAPGLEVGHAGGGGGGGGEQSPR